MRRTAGRRCNRRLTTIWTTIWWSAAWCCADDGRRYDRFRHRIMFPIRSSRGDIIGFGGRVLDQGEPKCLNSPETPLFEKGREL